MTSLLRRLADSRRLLALTMSCLLLILPATVLADRVELTSFTAHYRLFKGGIHVANTELSLKRSGEFWRWRMSTVASGIYKLFSSSRPFSETTLKLTDTEFQIQNVLTADASDKKTYRTARFNWEKGSVEILGESSPKQFELQSSVFTFDSIHVLAASMINQHQRKRKVEFYDDGKMQESYLSFIGKSDLELHGKTLPSNVFKQTMSGTKSSLIYSYDTQHPILPLKIEKIKPGESSLILTLEDVKW